MNLMRSSYFIGIIGAGALVGSLLITLWLTEPITPPNIKTTLPNKEACKGGGTSGLGQAEGLYRRSYPS
jgi:hypothetical protein